jgi:hypothetical protein
MLAPCAPSRVSVLRSAPRRHCKFDRLGGTVAARPRLLRGATSTTLGASSSLGSVGYLREPKPSSVHLIDERLEPTPYLGEDEELAVNPALRAVAVPSTPGEIIE